MLLKLKEKPAERQPASDIFAVRGHSVGNLGIIRLIDLMGSRNYPFYQAAAKSPVSGQNGLIGPEDTVIIKVNSQWAERGGTNTDLLKSLIKAITDHPAGFKGEIIVADNGQAQYGSARTGGSLDWEVNNAEGRTQSVQKVADSFSQYRVSTYLWDKLTTVRVQEYSDGDIRDGYFTSGKVNEYTGMMVSYPKFQTRWGTYISFKLGKWDPDSQKYDNHHLKFINVPVLKSHFIYGVTGCVKHYMGVVADKLTAELGARSHQLVARGGLGSEMVGTRFPVLNILDAIWVNAKPGGGPGTPDNAATRADVVLAGTDPVALDYWAAKHILMGVARELGYTDLSAIDPDSDSVNSFGNCFARWLKLSQEEITRSGRRTTMDESFMNVYISEA
jgi:uncharacterized protein (DUF362 family)